MVCCYNLSTQEVASTNRIRNLQPPSRQTPTGSWLCRQNPTQLEALAGRTVRELCSKLADWPSPPRKGKRHETRAVLPSAAAVSRLLPAGGLHARDVYLLFTTLQQQRELTIHLQDLLQKEQLMSRLLYGRIMSIINLELSHGKCRTKSNGDGRSRWRCTVHLHEAYRAILIQRRRMVVHWKLCHCSSFEGIIGQLGTF